MPRPLGCQERPPAPLCNPGFPGTFNLSLTEPEMLEEFGGYLDIAHDLIYSKVQPCIRFNDWAQIKADPLGSHHHLLLFHMADVGGIQILRDGYQRAEAVRHSVTALHNLLTQVLGLDQASIRFQTLRPGLAVRDITQGKYEMDDVVPEFAELTNVLHELGYTSGNVILDATRDSFLALNVYGRPTPWGHRSEVLYDHNGQMLDIGTVELLCYRGPLEDAGERKLLPWSHALAVAAIGIERCAFVAEHRQSMYEQPPYSDLLRLWPAVCSRYDTLNAALLSQVLVAFYFLSAEIEIATASWHRRKKLRSIVTSVLTSSQLLGFPLSDSSLRSAFELIGAGYQTERPCLVTSATEALLRILSGRTDQRSLRDQRRR